MRSRTLTPNADDSHLSPTPLRHMAQRLDAPNTGNLVRMLQVLNLFGADRPALRDDDLLPDYPIRLNSAVRWPNWFGLGATPTTSRGSSNRLPSLGR